MNEAAIEEALATLRPSMEADGFDLHLAETKPDGDVVVAIEAKPDACMDCLVSDDVLVLIIDDAIREKAIPGVGSVSLIKRGFDQQ